MRFLDWFKRKSADDAPKQTAEELLTELRAYSVEVINPGFRPLDEVMEIVRDTNESSETPLDTALVEQMVRESWKARQEELHQANAVAAGRPDDYSRLQLAFEALEAQGIVARMNFTCCQTCGHSEIHDERQPDGAETGYVFFHQQDADGLAEENTRLYFAFGPYREALPIDPSLFELAESGDEAARLEIDQLWENGELAVGKCLAAALTAQGLTVDWEGTTAQRPSIMITDWRKPLPG